MNVNVNDLNNGLIDVVAELIGHRLATIPTGPSGETSPAVMPVGSLAPQQDRPFILVDHIGMQRIGFGPVNTGIDDNGDEFTDEDYKLQFSISLYATTDDDTLGIISELRTRLFTSRGKRLICDNVDATTLNISDITFGRSVDSTDFTEVGKFTYDFTVRLRITDTTVYVIDSISLEGDLYDDFNQSYPPLDVDTQVGPDFN